MYACMYESVCYQGHTGYKFAKIQNNEKTFRIKFCGYSKQFYDYKDDPQYPTIHWNICVIILRFDGFMSFCYHGNKNVTNKINVIHDNDVDFRCTSMLRGWQSSHWRS